MEVARRGASVGGRSRDGVGRRSSLLVLGMETGRERVGFGRVLSERSGKRARLE